MKKVTGFTQFVPDIPNWVIIPMARIAQLLGSPMGICPTRVKKLQISTNICGEKLKNCGYQFKWSFEEALADWFEDNDRKGAEVNWMDNVTSGEYQKYYEGMYCK